MKKLCCAVIALLPLSVFAYPIELEKQLNGAEVSASTQDVDFNMGAIQLYNYGKAAAQCQAVFRNGPEAPRTRKIQLAAGQDALLTAKFTNQVIKLRIKLTCNPQ
ncbi:3-phosphoglycerate kinase [Pseudomonas sp. 2FG]|uniref:3-phosphoglycerate kinase n=1 Tax=Pseudomonas sp. 2FG TaxID=2502191 RepID=UPI0010F7765A|nr:3-phosphoglycerate kinase [Pseudomonas sp. 2FG]